jgi:molybdopterin molybdotransferase
MISLDEAFSLLKAEVTPLDPIVVPLEKAFDLRLAEAPLSKLDLPGRDVSAMDGYAVRYPDLAGKPLRVAQVIPAGADPLPLEPDSAARIFTGATLPQGADTIIPQELAEIQSDKTVTLKVLPRGSHVRKQGAILKKGAKLGSIGDLLTPGRIALMAAGGVDRVKVYPKPTVALVITGSELIDANTVPKPSALRDSNGPMLAAFAAKAGFRVISRSYVADDLDASVMALHVASKSADLIIASGGVSVGDLDFVPQAVKNLCGQIVFHKVSIKPGKPALAARLGKAWLLGLPGNPVSALCCWKLFALPLGMALAGDKSALPPTMDMGILTEDAANDEDRTLLLTSKLDWTDRIARITPLPSQGSHDIFTASNADALVRIESGVAYHKGDKVSYYPI